MESTPVDGLLIKAQDEGLYKALICQLNKDFGSIIDMAIPEKTEPNQLKIILHKNIEYLLQQDVAGYQNLLYKIDVSEKKITSITTENTKVYIESVLGLILQREWQKVWFRNKL